MYLPLIAVLFDETIGQGFSIPLIAHGLDGAVQMVHKAHPQLALRGLYDRDTLQTWIDVLQARPAAPAANGATGTVMPQRFIAVMVDAQAGECVPVEAIDATEAQAVLDERLPGRALSGLFPQATVEGFMRALERLETKLHVPLNAY